MPTDIVVAEQKGGIGSSGKGWTWQQSRGVGVTAEGWEWQQSRGVGVTAEQRGRHLNVHVQGRESALA